MGLFVEMVGIRLPFSLDKAFSRFSVASDRPPKASFQNNVVMREGDDNEEKVG